ncbi:SRPBCC domain-containing protein [Streptomyces sp. NPDC059460]|uniref:SRPBCC family protein n=1 Tax=Streptomyces sp. NPDC059460 TaxID=3346840 RepID=UPI00369BFE3E
MTTTDQVVLERRIAARPETVFSFFTDREKWLSWMGRDGEFSFTPGGAYRTGVNAHCDAVGQFLAVDPYHRVVFTWGYEDGAKSVPPGASTVEVTLAPDGEGTLLTLFHRDLPTEACAPHFEGWAHYLDRLVERAEGGDPGPDKWLEPHASVPH